MKRILFVCTGNTCRSPMAEAVLLHHGKEVFEVKSAGVFADAGSDASMHAKMALKEQGIEINHTSQQLNEELLQWADIVLTMTKGHKQTIAQYHPGSEEKVHTLYEYTERVDRDISDPYGGSIEMYRKTLNELNELLQRFVKNQSDKGS